jgi:hypothetical protein
MKLTDFYSPQHALPQFEPETLPAAGVSRGAFLLLRHILAEERAGEGRALFRHWR